MRPLTSRQAEILDFIVSYQGKHTYPPTVAEIAENFGFRSPNASASHLNALKKKGYIDITPRASRGIRVLRNASGIGQESKVAPGVPILGSVAAGSPILAEEHREDEMTLDAEAFSYPADYLLRVVGDSMIDLGIFEGDLVAVYRTPDVRNGDVIVANLNGEATVKTYQKKSGKVSLLPANKRLKPIEVNPAKDEFVVDGVVVGLIRAIG
ncbi:MAG: transcriptional repressor LexA [Planctomycetes bacterium]|nr:transcriptional repressor LexA [Planctomycetota bacterium]